MGLRVPMQIPALFVEKFGNSAYDVIALVANNLATIETAANALNIPGAGAGDSGKTLRVKATEDGYEVIDASTARTNLGLGSIATQASDNVAITGGSVNVGTLQKNSGDVLSAGASEISQLTAKAILVDGDLLVIEDSEDQNKKKKVTLSALKTYLGL